jgi:hypothetical protein
MRLQAYVLPERDSLKKVVTDERLSSIPVRNASRTLRSLGPHDDIERWINDAFNRFAQRTRPAKPWGSTIERVFEIRVRRWEEFSESDNMLRHDDAGTLWMPTAKRRWGFTPLCKGRCGLGRHDM